MRFRDAGRVRALMVGALRAGAGSGRAPGIGAGGVLTVEAFASPAVLPNANGGCGVQGSAQRCGRSGFAEASQAPFAVLDAPAPSGDVARPTLHGGAEPSTARSARPRAGA